MKTMKTIVKYALVLCLVATLWGCRKKDVMPEPERGGGTPVAFASDDRWDVRTRAAGSATNHFPNETRMGLFAFYTPEGGSLDAETQEPDFMKNQAVKASTSAITTDEGILYSTSWSYSPVKYWPTAQGDAISFFGYYPWVPEAAAVNSVDIPLDGTQNVMWINSVNGNAVSKSYTLPSSQYAGNTVKLNFEHKLMRLRFEFLVKLGEGGFDYTPHVENLVVKPAEGAELYNVRLNLTTGETAWFGTNRAKGFRLLRDADGGFKDRFETYDVAHFKDHDFIAGEMYIDPEADDENAADPVKSLVIDINIGGLIYSKGIILKNPAAGNSYLVELTFDSLANSVESVLTLENWITYTSNDEHIIR